MIPILYSKTDQSLAGSGVGFLIDAIKCPVTEERNGIYEMELQYPISGQWFAQISEGALVKTKPNDTSAPQLFRIYKSSSHINGRVSFYGKHISYDLNGYQLAGFTAIDSTPKEAIEKALAESGASEKFRVESDIDTINSTSIAQPCSVRNLLGGKSGSILDVWGGEYEFDNFTIKLHRHRGKDSGVCIRYGKNLKDLNQDRDISNCYTHILPYAVIQDPSGTEGAETYVYLAGEKTIKIAEESTIGRKRVYLADLTDRFGEGETIDEAALRLKAIAYAETCNLNVPKISLTVDFIPLWQTEEYKEIAPLERVSLCDEVSVYHTDLGVNGKAKVIKTVYDSLNERYEKIELGDARSNFAKTASQLTDTAQTMENYLYHTVTAANGVFSSKIRLLASANQYAVGEKSPSDGLVSGTSSTLRNGMIYVPTASHDEGDFSFEYGKTYSWDSNECGWKELQAVSIDTLPTTPETGSLAYFATDSEPYKAGYLYVYDSVSRTWTPIASTYDEYRTIALSSFRQTIDGITAEVSRVEKKADDANEDLSQSFTSQMQMNENAIRQSVEEQYVKNGEIEKVVSSRVTQLSDSWEATFTSLKKVVDDNAKSNQAQHEEIERYVRIENGLLRLGKVGNATETAVEHNGMAITTDETEVLTARADGVNALNLTARQYLTIGTNSRFEDYEDDRTACFWIGGSTS